MTNKQFHINITVTLIMSRSLPKQLTVITSWPAPDNDSVSPVLSGSPERPRGMNAGQSAEGSIRATVAGAKVAQCLEVGRELRYEKPLIETELHVP